MIQPRDFIETRAGLLFAAISEKAAFLRYFPSPEGNRFRNRVRYQKVASTQVSFDFLEKNYPEYILDKSGYRLQFCPPERILRVHKPFEKLSSLRKSESELAKKCTLLSDIFNYVPAEKKGVTGSLLVNLVTRDSDIDFVIYGRNDFDESRRILRDSREIEKLDRMGWKHYYKKRFPRGGELDFETFLWHEQRKFNLGRIDGTLFNLLMVDDGIEISNGTTLKKTKIRCRVLDASCAFNVPSVYVVDHELVKTVVSFTHTYAGQAKEGEGIEVSGMLEKIAEGEFRIIVGTTREAVGEYVRVVNPVLDEGEE
jgi:predicted nucleotidyltransferase